jgi:hypothetical protein
MVLVYLTPGRVRNGDHFGALRLILLYAAHYPCTRLAS